MFKFIKRDILIIFFINIYFYINNIYNILNNKSITGLNGDTGQILWWLKVNSDAIRSYENPLFTIRGNFPDGVSALWNQSLLFYSFLYAIVRDFIPLITFYNLLTVCITFLNMLSIYLFLHWEKRENKLVLSIFYGLNSLVLLHIQGHLNIASLFLLPFIVYNFKKYIVTNNKSNILYFTISTFLQFFTSQEVLLFSIIASLIYIKLTPNLIITNYKKFIKLFALNSLFLIYPVKFMLFSGEKFLTQVQDSNKFKNNLLTFLLPNDLNLITFRNFIYDYAQGREAYGYIGIGFFSIIIYKLVSEKKISYYLSSLVILYIFSLGNELNYLGDSGVKLPFAFLENLQVIKHVIPSRISILVFLSAIFYLSDSKLISDKRYKITILLSLSLLITLPKPLGDVNENYKIPNSVKNNVFCKNVKDKRVYMIPLSNPGKPEGMIWQSLCEDRFYSYGTYNIVKSNEIKGKGVWGNFDIVDLINLRLQGDDLLNERTIRINVDDIKLIYRNKRVQIITINNKEENAINFYKRIFKNYKVIDDITYFYIAP